MGLIESSINKYDNDANPFYNASYELIKNKPIWKDFNQNWIDKLALVFSWMPRIAGKDLHEDYESHVRGGESLVRGDNES